MKQLNRTLIAALKKVVAKESKEWFEETTPKVNLQSEELDAFFQDVYDANSEVKGTHSDIFEEMEAEGLDPADKDYQEYAERTSEADNDISTNQLFKEPKVLKNVSVIHFTNLDPGKLIKEIQNENFEGCTYSNIGLTWHLGCESGPLGFGFLADKKSSSHYGKHAIEFTAEEAVEAYHDSDGELQVIWDSEFVKDFKIIK